MTRRSPKIANLAVSQVKSRDAQRGGLALPDKGKLIPILVVTVFVIVLAIVLYLLYRIRRRNFGEQVLVDTMFNITSNPKFPTVTLDSSTTNAYSFSFWMYVVKFDPLGVDAGPSHIWSATAKTKTTPICCMDGSTNKMYLSFALGNVDMTASSKCANTNNPDDLKSLTSGLGMNGIGDLRLASPCLNYVTLTIDYVPLQRWVNLAVIVDSKMLTVYMDGQVHSVRAASDFETYDSAGNPNLVRPMFSTDLPMSFSSATSLTKNPNQNIALSSMRLYNFPLSQRDVQNKYRAGPHAADASWLDWLGFGSVKFQWPIVYTPEPSNKTA